MSRILIGTCSWTDKSLIDARTFYPPWANDAESRLRFYASVFPTVEVDSTYYALPSRQTSALWVRRTPDDFLFHIKVFRLFTHHWTQTAMLPRDLRSLAPAKDRFYLRDAPQELQGELLRRFVDFLLPLDSAGKLGVVLFQFPKWVPPRPDVFEHLVEMRAALASYNVGVEFRNKAWLEGPRQERTLRWLEDHGLTFVSVDEPQGFSSSVPPVGVATTDTGYVRLHGRNTATWEARGESSADRFDYYYKPSELQEWMLRIQGMLERARQVHVLVNTNKADQGPRNAVLMGRLLGEGLGDEEAVRNLEFGWSSSAA